MTTAPQLARRVAIPLAIYALLEWLFAYVTATEGLVTPRAALDPTLLAIGGAYLAVRIAVRVLLPGVAAFALARAAAERALARRRAGPRCPGLRRDHDAAA
jgi:hypothetical protein